MSQSPTWSASTINPGDTASTAANVAATPAAAPVPPERGYGRLSPLQTAAATAVIFTSLVVLAAMTGVFSLHGSDEPAPLGAASTSPLRSAGGPVPGLGAASLREPADMITEVDNPPAALRSSPALTADALKDSPTAIAGAAPANAAPLNAGGSAGIAPRIAPDVPAPQMAAATPSAPQRSARRAVPHPEHPHRTHQGKTREQVIEELMQAKRDGSYRTLQENYR